MMMMMMMLGWSGISMQWAMMMNEVRRLFGVVRAGSMVVFCNLMVDFKNTLLFILKMGKKNFRSKILTGPLINLVVQLEKLCCSLRWVASFIKWVGPGIKWGGPKIKIDGSWRRCNDPTKTIWTTPKNHLFQARPPLTITKNNATNSQNAFNPIKSPKSSHQKKI
jgi:hypothetical protein